MKRRVKIVCTVGPASSSPEVIEGLLKAGMDVARFNLAYGTPAEHTRLMREVHRLSQKLGLPTGILVDLPGPKHRTGGTREVFGEHLRFAVSQKATFIALSLISSAGEVKEVKELMAELNADTPIIAKIEKAQAVEECQAILEVCEGIMVARGDLGLQIAIEKVPLAQKRLIMEANERGKPVITATQMLESMVQSPTPTRAEAADVANAVLDGTDALMLSEETAIGRYPIEATEMMARIALEVDAGFPYGHTLHEEQQGVLADVSDATARAACQMAEQVGARAIVAFTTGGATALRVSKYRPRQPILAVTTSDTVVRRLSLSWGVIPVKGPQLRALDALLQRAAEVTVKTGLAERGDLVVITAGLPLGVSGSTNLVKVHELV